VTKLYYKMGGKDFKELKFLTWLSNTYDPSNLSTLLKGGPKRWGDPLTTQGTLAKDDAKSAYVVDTLTLPFDNPFKSWMRTAAHDFFSDGRMAVSTLNGDVWIVDGIDKDLKQLKWTRFATGLYEPLGLRIVN